MCICEYVCVLCLSVLVFVFMYLIQAFMNSVSDILPIYDLLIFFLRTSVLLSEFSITEPVSVSMIFLTLYHRVSYVSVCVVLCYVVRFINPYAKSINIVLFTIN